MRSNGTARARVAHSLPDCQASQQLLTIRPLSIRSASLASLATIRNTVAPTIRWGQTAGRLTLRNNSENLARGAKQRETLRI